MLALLPTVAVIGLIGDERCSISYRNPGYHSLRWRVCGQYFWFAFGLALALWIQFLSLALLEHGYRSGSDLPEGSEPPDMSWMALGLIGVSIVIYAICVGGSSKRTHCTQPLWRVITLYVIAVAALPGIFHLLSVLYN
jgi:hypothetical protein